LTLPSAIGFLLAGLLLLAIGGEVLVRGATRLALRVGLTPAVIGVTVVAMGTSLPELIVSFAAATKGTPDIAIANVIGSNIINITGTLGLTALIRPLPARGAIVTLQWPVMFVATIAAVAFLRDATIDQLEGGLFLIAIVVFVGYSARFARQEIVGSERVALANEVEGLAPDPRPSLGRAALLLISGLVLLILGGDLLVRGAVALAQRAGMSERVIGLTVVAIGTGAPEIAASLAAARNETEMALSNLIGSNIFNLLAILGVIAVWQPIRFSGDVASQDLWWLLGTTVLLLPVLLVGKRVSRPEGALLLIVYAVYLWRLL
jgi:cation:H+ antiporter